MSYLLTFDAETDPEAQTIESSHDWRSFCSWSWRQDYPRFDRLVQFAENGFTPGLATLGTQLREALALSPPADPSARGGVADWLAELLEGRGAEETSAAVTESVEKRERLNGQNN